MSLKELEQIQHVAQSTAAGIVSRLEQKGLLEALGDPEDKRIKKVRITAEGIERCKEAEQHMEQTEEYILSRLTETEQGLCLLYVGVCGHMSCSCGGVYPADAFGCSRSCLGAAGSRPAFHIVCGSSLSKDGT